MAKNVIIPQKNTGDLRTALEDNQVTDFLVAPSQSLGTFDGSLILMDGTGNYTDFTMSANLVISFAETAHEEGNLHFVLITADGTDTLTFIKPDAYTLLIPSNLTNEAVLASGVYLFSFTFIGGAIKVNFITLSSVANNAPTMTSATIEDATDNVLDFVFSDAVTITTAGWNIDTDGAALTISSVLSGSGTTTPKFQLSRSVLDTETLNIDYDSTTGNTIRVSNSVELVTFTDTAIVNNVLGSALLTSLISNWNFNETTGTRLDSHTNNNDLADVGSVGFAAGKIGNAAQFSGSNELSIASNASLQTGDIDFTITAWVYLDSLVSSGTILAKWGNSGDFEYRLLYSQGSDRLSWKVSASGTNTKTVDADTFGAPSTDTWYFLIAEHDSTADEIRISVNNGSSDSLAHSGGMHVDTIDLEFGTEQGGNDLIGRVDEITIWKRLLTTQEKADMYNAGAGLAYPF